MQEEFNQYYHPIFTAQSAPQSIHTSNSGILIALKDHSIINFEKDKFSITDNWKSPHVKKISGMKRYGNMVGLCSYDSTVTLWDMRDRSLIHTFKKPGAQFTSLDCSQYILAVGYKSNIVFCDLRKMKVRGQFHQSFYGEISCLTFDQKQSTTLLACSLDGMVNRFNLSQPNQQQSLQWGYRIQESPQYLHYRENTILIQTKQHSLITIYNQDIINTLNLNNSEIPKHILYAKISQKFTLQNCTPDYYLWNLKENQIEYYSQTKCLGRVQNVNDIQIFTSIDNNGKKIAFFGDQKGNFYAQKLSLQQKPRKNIQKLQTNWNNIQNQKQIYTKNGFIISKPSTLKNSSKKFRPY